MSAQLSIVVPYRKRPSHLTSLLSWMRTRGIGERTDIELIVVEGDAVATAASSAVESMGARYLHLPCAGPFSKTAALNAGLSVSHAPWIMPWDVDLLPIDDAFERHVAAAQACPDILVTGYRLMSSRPALDAADIAEAAREASLAPEDRETSVMLRLTQGERFGINPIFHRERLQTIDGWDEEYVGWGAEDQDILERYIADRRVLLVRSPDIIYLHLWHGQERDWSEVRYVSANRQRYYRQHRERNED